MRNSSDQGEGLKRLIVALAATVLAVAMFGSGAVADTKQERKAVAQFQAGSQRSITDGVVDTPFERTLQQQSQMELAAAPQGLPASRKNMKAVSKLKLTNADSIISDVTYHKGYAYVGEWIASCTEGDGGTYDSEVHVVDLRDRSNPRKVATIPGNGNDWSGEGVHVIRHRNRDLLLLSSEPCDSNLDENVGGMTIVDVTNPRRPEKLVTNFGDWTTLDEEGNPVDCREDAEPCVTPHSVHSVMGWVDGNKAYAVQVDNEEWPDIDIFDISRPWARQPRLIAETGINDWVDEDGNITEISDQLANGATAFIHDMQVKKIDNRWRMMVSYWDAGWVLLNVNDPTNPRVLDDYDYPDPDPLTGFSPPEGNAHQSWWSKDNRFVIGTDEDFSPYRLQFEITSGPNAGTMIESAAISGDSPQIDVENPLVGPTEYLGEACAPVPAAPSSDHIALISRGTCSFRVKYDNMNAAGYKGMIVHNNQAGSPPNCEGLLNMLLNDDSGPDVTKPSVFVPMSAGYTIMGVDGYTEEACLAGDPLPALPAPGTDGPSIAITAEFDGWGYVQLFRGSNLNHVDEYAVPESLDPRYASGFGDLSVHEVKTDPRGNYLGYIAYYHAGARVVKFGREGIREVGHFISRRGNNFWGTFPLREKKKGPIPLLMSDRDYGLYVLKYTGNQFTP
jgi:hypothetical protein